MNTHIAIAAFAVWLLSALGIAISISRQRAIIKKIMRETEIIRAASMTKAIPRVASSIDDFDIVAKVIHQVNAMYYKRQLTVVRKSLEDNGFRCVLDSGQVNNISYSDIPYSIRVEAAEAMMRERHAQLYPNGSGEAQTKFISDNVKDGYAQLLLDEIFEALAGLGFVIIENHTYNGQLEESA